MTTITATVNPDRASVAIALAPTGSVAAVIRHDANGIRPVRFPLGTFPTTRAVQVDDWEAALTGPVTYSAGDATARVVLDGTGPWLTPPMVPSASVPLVSVSGYDSARDSSSEVTPLAGGSAVVKLGDLGGRSGTFSVLCADHGVAVHLEALLGRYPLQFLRVPEHGSMDLYFIASRIRISPDLETGLWEVGVEYVETPVPESGLSTWTYAAVAETYDNLAHAARSYASLGGLAINDKDL